MNVVFRTDASVRIGTGHVMRCLTLAEALRDRDVTVSFICRELPGNYCAFLEKKGFQVYRLPHTEPSLLPLDPRDLHEQWLGVPWETDANETKSVLAKHQEIDLLVVDNYQLDIRWESMMRPHVSRIMVIDDLANRFHDCDILLDQNLAKNYETRYADLVPQGCRLFLGPQFALLRPEFHESRKKLKNRSGHVSRILVSFGGSDPSNVTGKTFRTLVKIGQPNIKIDFVVGETNPNIREIKNYCKLYPNTTFHCQVENMAQIISDADLALGGGGTSMWERCYLGLPSIVLVIAENQAEGALALNAVGAIRNLGRIEDVSEDILEKEIRLLLKNPALLKKMSQKALSLTEALNMTGCHFLFNELLQGRNSNATA